jgi:hypothetical protein
MASNKGELIKQVQEVIKNMGKNDDNNKRASDNSIDR